MFRRARYRYDRVRSRPGLPGHGQTGLRIFQIFRFVVFDRGRPLLPPYRSRAKTEYVSNPGHHASAAVCTSKALSLALRSKANLCGAFEAIRQFSSRVYVNSRCFVPDGGAQPLKCYAPAMRIGHKCYTSFFGI